MNDKVNPEKFRKLPIAALVNGILTYGNACLVFWVNAILFNLSSIPLTILISFWAFSLPIAAIVCGSIDLKRSKAGFFRNKVFKGMDIAGIVLGSVFILIVAAFFLADMIGSEPEYEPAWSPDGTKIAVTYYQGSTETIRVMEADGSDLTNLGSGGSSPAWSPDGTKIAFVSYPNGDICAMNADGSNIINLTNSDAEQRFPSWSPDGTKIAFASLSSGNADIWVMEADGSDQINLTNSASDDCFPSWSPDGTKIAFESEQQGNADIWVMEADGSGQINLTNSATGGYDPAWSPDGTKIAFTDGVIIYVMDADGSNQTKLTK